ncbi:MAG: hypothetical protein IJ600_12980 [Lachnospiraceae bacterium]|nr:hypothetical protein [Lachnospiraceae bacterium]
MATIYVNWQELENKATELEGFNTKLISECDAYKANADALKGSFEGDVATDFYKEAQEHQDKMKLFTDLVSKYVKAMRDMAETARKKEMEAQSVIAQKN